MTATQAALINHKSYLQLLTYYLLVILTPGLIVGFCTFAFLLMDILLTTCICCISKYFINTLLLPLAKQYIYFRENHIFFHFLILSFRPIKSTRCIPVYCTLLLLDSCFTLIHSCFVVDFRPVCTQLF